MGGLVLYKHFEEKYLNFLFIVHFVSIFRYAKVVLRLDENEVEMALGDKTLLSSIVDDVSCLE